MNEEEEVIHVHIGEVKLGTPTSTMKVILGSCIGIGLFWKVKNRLAVAHCLLPEGETTELPGKFINQAVKSLCRLLEVPDAQTDELEAVIAGGANMYQDIGPSRLRVGELNIRAVMKCLTEKKIKIIFRDLGENHGRQLIINAKTGEYYVRVLEGF